MSDQNSIQQLNTGRHTVLSNIDKKISVTVKNMLQEQRVLTGLFPKLETVKSLKRKICKAYALNNMDSENLCLRRDRNFMKLAEDNTTLLEYGLRDSCTLIVEFVEKSAGVEDISLVHRKCIKYISYLSNIRLRRQQVLEYPC